MFVTSSYRLGQPDTIDDGCVVEGVADDGIFGSEYCLEETGICVEATRK